MKEFFLAKKRVPFAVCYHLVMLPAIKRIVPLLLPALFLLLLPGFASGQEKNYIVVYKDKSDLRQEIKSLKQDSNQVKYIYDDVFKGASVVLDDAERQALAKDPSVSLIEADKTVRANRATSLWGLDRIDQEALPLDGNFNPTSTGAGVDVYVVDTGIRADHTEFTGRVRAGYSNIPDDRGTGDCDGHGTHVSGTIAGSTYGVASEANIIPVRVLDCLGSGSWSAVIAGMDWIVKHHVVSETAVVNMSLGSNYLETVDLAVDRLVADRIAVVVSAGNETRDACLTSPGSTPSAITVGSTTSTDARSSFSNFGSCVDLFAPGSSILSAGISSATSTAYKSGTSMAAPHVAGAAAVLLGNGFYSPAQITSALLADATTGVVTDARAGSPNLLLYSGSDISAPPPPPARPGNDNFSNAASILRNQSLSGSNFYASKEIGEPVHVNADAKAKASVWFRYLATHNGTLTLDTHGSNFDTLLSVYEGNALGNLVEKTANDDDPRNPPYLTSRVDWDVVAGETYYIALDGYGGAIGDYALNSALFVPPPGQPTFQGIPNGLTTETSATFAFAATTAGTTFQCRLNEGGWESCVSPKTYTDLASRAHTLRVRSIDDFGQVSAETAYTWEIDAIAPSAPAIVEGPAGVVAPTSAAFRFTGESGARYFCSLDNQAEQECTSPVAYSGLAYGAHSFRVRQADRVGNRSSVSTRTWEIAPSAPSITSGPAGGTFDNWATFTFFGIPGASFQCRLDGSAWEDCWSGKSYQNITPGAHIFELRQIYTGLISEPRGYSWLVQQKAIILSAPRITQAPPTKTTNRSARFAFSGVTGARFQCRLDAGEWQGCSSPRTYNNLAIREHVFRVRQIKDGVTSAAQARTWRIVAR